MFVPMLSIVNARAYKFWWFIIVQSQQNKVTIILNLINELTSPTSQHTDRLVPNLSAITRRENEQSRNKFFWVLIRWNKICILSKCTRISINTLVFKCESYIPAIVTFLPLSPALPMKWEGIVFFFEGNTEAYARALLLQWLLTSL